MESFAQILTEIAPAIIAGGGLLWSFSKQITHIEAKLQNLEHSISDCKEGINLNRQGRIEVFGVINGTLKPKDNDMSERLARVEERQGHSINISELYTRLARLESEMSCLKDQTK